MNHVDHSEEFTCIEFCACYGGIGLGLARAIRNLRVVAFLEVEAFACANLVAKIEAGLLDAAPIWTDVNRRIIVNFLLCIHKKPASTVMGNSPSQSESQTKLRAQSSALRNIESPCKKKCHANIAKSNFSPLLDQPGVFVPNHVPFLNATQNPRESHLAIVALRAIRNFSRKNQTAFIALGSALMPTIRPPTIQTGFLCLRGAK